MHAKLDCHGLTNIGLRRKENQDQFLIAHLGKSMAIHKSTLQFNENGIIHGRVQGQLLIVADGMGGHTGGKRASELAVDTMAHCLLDVMRWPLETDADDSGRSKRDQLLLEAMDTCQERLEQEGIDVPAHAEMGTTLTVGLIFWPTLYLVHVGDSRAYLLRGEKLTQLTEDQTIAQRLLRMGAIAPNELATSAFSHTLWSYLGGKGASVKPDLRQVKLEINDTLLLCSDGLSNPVSESEIHEILDQEGTAREQCQKLIDCALAAGGPDNITAVVAQIRNASQASEVVRQEVTAEPRPDETEEIVAPIMEASE